MSFSWKGFATKNLRSSWSVALELHWRYWIRLRKCIRLTVRVPWMSTQTQDLQNSWSSDHNFPLSEHIKHTDASITNHEIKLDSMDWFVGPCISYTGALLFGCAQNTSCQVLHTQSIYIVGLRKIVNTLSVAVLSRHSNRVPLQMAPILCSRNAPFDSNREASGGFP
jgi:hypothetical protein